MNPQYTRRVIAASLLLGASPLALAQEAPEPETLETVIVTGVGPQRETDEMIGNATAINRAELVEKLSGTLGDTLAGEAGVSTTFFGQGASRPVLRGLGAERVLVLTNGIGAIDASAASPDHQVATDGIDAEKIEITNRRHLYSVDMQFVGQTHLIRVPLPGPNMSRADLQQLFEEAYFNRFRVDRDMR